MIGNPMTLRIHLMAVTTHRKTHTTAVAETSMILQNWLTMRGVVVLPATTIMLRLVGIGCHSMTLDTPRHRIPTHLGVPLLRMITETPAMTTGNRRPPVVIWMIVSALGLRPRSDLQTEIQAGGGMVTAKVENEPGSVTPGGTRE
jgi:hypothetical protein